MSKAYKWTTKSEDGHWVSYCTSHDLPRIIELKGKTKKDKKFKVDAGKLSRIEPTWDAAVDYAVEVGKKLNKEVKKLERQGKL